MSSTTNISLVQLGLYPF